jgi:predicted phage gp36 major capsid-like protein
MLRNLGVFIGCLVIAFFAGKYQARQEIQAEVTRIETQMQEAADQAADKLHKEKQDAQTKINQLRADVATGALRLSVRASCSAGDAAGDSEERAELDPKTADDLIAIAADGDQAIIELNACIDFYNNLRSIK